MEKINEFLQIVLIAIGNFSITILSLVSVIGIIIIAKLVLWLINKALFHKSKIDTFENGNLQAVFQIIKYIVWVIAIAFILKTFSINITVLLAGSAALLVGIGLGLQQTFNDIISGIILLSERTIKINDVLELDGDVVIIQHIGLRTSKGLSRDDISIIIPNSLITTNKVINWSHQTQKTRFRINVGVAYGSDVDLVLKTLIESASEHPEISDINSVESRLVDFGESSLNFQLFFYSENVFTIERMKSQIRIVIDRKFRQKGITIPFPQVDLHIKSKSSDVSFS